VADHDRLLQSQLATLPADVVRKSGDGVVLLRRIAGAVAAKIDGYDTAALREVSDLGREDAVVTGPAVDENDWCAFRSLGALLKMR